MGNKYKIFDTHAHYDDEAFDVDREELIEELHNNGVVGILDCASSYESIDKVCDIVNRWDFIYGALGIHPENADEFNDEVLNEIKEKIKANYILGVESTSSRMFANAKTYLFRNRIKTQEEVIEKIDKITNEDIRYVLDSTFKHGVLNAAYVGQDVDECKLNSIILKNIKAYDNKDLDNKINV